MSWMRNFIIKATPLLKPEFRPNKKKKKINDNTTVNKNNSFMADLKFKEEEIKTSTSLLGSKKYT